MTSSTKARRILVAAAFLCIQIPAFTAEETSSSVTARFMSNPNLPVIIRGDYFKAVQIALKDFSTILAERAHQSASNDHNSSNQSAWTSKIENYDIHVEQTDSAYTIWFRPTMRDTAHIVMGGGVTYTIDRQTFSITKTVRSK